MAYTLNNIDLRTTFGIIPGQVPGSNLAVEGIFDLPKRIGETHYEWAESPMEPYVDADEIFFGGRDLKFSGFIIGSNKVINDYLQALYDTVEAFTDLVVFSTPYGDFNVQVRTIVPEYYNGGCKIVISFREPVVTLTGTTSTSVVKFGYLYPWYVTSDSRNICAPGSHIPTKAEFETLQPLLGGETAAGTHLKESGTTYWYTAGGDNSVGFNGRGGGLRDTDGGFLGSPTGGTYLRIWLATQYNATEAYEVYIAAGSTWASVGPGYKKKGGSLRPVKDSTTLSIGQTGTYTGNDGRVYSTICMPDGKEWVSESLAETEYQNGDPIPVVTDDTEWSTLLTGARCSLNNDDTNSLTITSSAIALPATGSSSYTIDSIPFSSFGLYYSKGGGMRSLADLKEQLFTKYGSEGYQMSKRKPRSFDLKGFIMASSLADFQTKIKQLYLIFSSAGLRDIIINNEIQIDCFAVDGFSVDNMILYGGGMIADFKITLICTHAQFITVDSNVVAVDDMVVTVDY